MIISEEEAKQGLCRVKQITMMRPIPQRMQEEVMCAGSSCISYWKWVDAEHTKGYCSITGKPEFE